MHSAKGNRYKAFSESPEGKLIREMLIKMVNSGSYNTVSSYSTRNPDGVTFIEKQMRYMCQYPTMNRMQYISNLKMKTKMSGVRKKF